jgi:hypothetical protein
MLEKTYTLAAFNVHNFLQETIGLGFRDIMSSIIDGDGEVTFYFTDHLTPEQLAELDSATSNHDATITVAKQIEPVIQAAIEFFGALTVTFAAENVALGITQSGKTKGVADYLANVLRYGQSGSLYEVINEIDALLAGGIPVELDPFVTIPRLNEFKNKILGYLT